jgi:hypothetical protein
VRNVSFVILAILALVAVEDVAAYDCPQGCSCESQGGPEWPFNPFITVYCEQVLDCDEVYPDFCSDFYNECSSFCGGSTMVLGFNCSPIGGACNGYCQCLLPNK